MGGYGTEHGAASADARGGVALGMINDQARTEIHEHYVVRHLRLGSVTGNTTGEEEVMPAKSPGHDVTLASHGMVSKRIRLWRDDGQTHAWSF